MLKIRDNVDLKEFEKYGFKILYNEKTGEPKELFMLYRGCFYDTRNKISFRKRFKLGLCFPIRKIWLSEFHDEYGAKDLDLWQDTLYDLIKDGLVEKVEE